MEDHKQVAEVDFDFRRISPDRHRREQKDVESNDDDHRSHRPFGLYSRAIARETTPVQQQNIYATSDNY